MISQNKIQIEIKGIRIRSILDRFTLEMLKILHQQLQQKHLNGDAFVQQLYQVLRREPFKSQLLFRDFNAASDETSDYHALLYISEILILYRLKPANNLMGKPGNMLRLLEILLQQGHPQATWSQARIKRSPSAAANTPSPAAPPSLATQLQQQKLAQLRTKLAQLRTKLAPNYSAIACNQREKYGPLQLHIGNDAIAEIPEELSLYEVISLLPLPLADGFVQQELIQLALVRVLDALNTRYMLLRACGLHPEPWLHRDTPSIQQLKELRNLRKSVMNEAAQQGIAQDEKLYRTVFDQLKGDHKKLAGYESYQELRESEVGQRLITSPTFFTDPSILADLEEGEEMPWFATSADHVEESAAEMRNDPLRERHEKIAELIRAYPELFDTNPVMRYFFERSLGEGIPLDGSGLVPSILDEPEFRQRIANDSRYASLTNRADLAKKIYADAKRIIAKGQRT